MASAPGALAVAGALALGAAWGHLLGLRGGRARPVAVAAATATALVAAEAWLLAGARGAAAFALAGAAAWAAGAAWYGALRRTRRAARTR